jgi:hypothetical protein
MSEYGGLRGIWEDFNNFLNVDVEVIHDNSQNKELPVILKFNITNIGETKEDRPEIIFEEVQLRISMLSDVWEEKFENLAGGQSLTYEHRCTYDAVMQLQWKVEGKVSPLSLLQFRSRPSNIKRAGQFPINAYFDFLEQMKIHQWLNGILKTINAPNSNTTLAEMKIKEDSLHNIIGEIRHSAQKLQDFLGLVNYKKDRDDIIRHKNQIEEYLKVTEREVSELVKALKSNQPDRFEGVRDNIVAKLSSRADSLDELTNTLAKKLGLLETSTDSEDNKDVLHEVQPPPPITLREIDLHGNTVEKAIPIINKFLEECYRDNVRRIRIIHGKGIFVLQKAIREILGTHRLVKAESISAADKDHGGEGATEADLIEFSAELLD